MSHFALFSLLGLSVACVAAAANLDNNSSISEAEQNKLLVRARSANTDTYSHLKSFVCREEIQRYKGNLQKTKVHVIDHVSTNLSFENGVERYENVRQNDRTVGSLPEINGAWSEGEFGTLLQQTEKLLETQRVNFVEFESVDGVSAAIYRFEVEEKESPWDLSVGAHHYQIPFTTDVWINVATGEMLRIARKSLTIPEETRISEIDWDVTLSAVDLSGTKWLLPAKAGYSVTYRESKRREWNEMSFLNYHRYGAESVLRFDTK